MQRTWRVGRFPDEVWITQPLGHALPAGAVEISPATAAWLAGNWFDGGGGSDRWLLAEIAEQIGDPLRLGTTTPATRLLDRVRDALGRGDLRAYRVEVKLASSAAPQKPVDDRRPERTVKEEKTFVVIELVDDADPPRPVAFEPYWLELPDSSVRQGQLDEHGRAELRDIDPGSCKVTFPRLLREDWWLA